MVEYLPQRMYPQKFLSLGIHVGVPAIRDLSFGPAARIEGFITFLFFWCDQDLGLLPPNHYCLNIDSDRGQLNSRKMRKAASELTVNLVEARGRS